MILSGLGVTVTISIAAGILGILLAFGLVFLRHRSRKVFNKLIEIYSRLIAGIPAVVILMVLYYIVFGAVNLPAVIVAIVGFALIFGARAYGVIWNAVCAVDPGQREAALALGYTENLAFRDIILPQSKDYYLPLLQAQFVTMVKETSIVGYITALDLTRAGDLIRSRTGLIPDAYFSASKIEWILDNVPGAREKAEEGFQLFRQLDNQVRWEERKNIRTSIKLKP